MTPVIVETRIIILVCFHSFSINLKFVQEKIMLRNSIPGIKTKKVLLTSLAHTNLFYAFGRNGIAMAKSGNFVSSRKSIRIKVKMKVIFMFRTKSLFDILGVTGRVYIG